MTLASSLSWAEAHPVTLAVSLWLLVSLVTAVTPMRFRTSPWYGWLVKLGDRLSIFTHPDAAGTLKLPGLASAIDPRLAAALAVAEKATVTRSNSGFASPRAMRIAALVAMAGAVLVPVAIAIAASVLHGCSAPQRTWDANARIGINSAAHVLRDVDSALAIVYQHEAHAATTLAQLDAIDARYAPAVTAERLARDALVDAEHAVDAAVATSSRDDRCRVRTAVVHANQLLVDAVRAARDLGATVPDAIEDLGRLAVTLAAECGQ